MAAKTQNERDFDRDIRKLFNAVLTLVIAVIIAAFVLSAAIAHSTKPDIVYSFTQEQGSQAQETAIPDTVIEECTGIDPAFILVLGCAVWENNEPSPMLKDRLDAAIALYKAGAAPKLLLTGDSSEDNNEVDCMLKYTLEQGVPEEDILTDPEGASTFDSIYRAQEVYGAGSFIVVTQKYHMFRALKICDLLRIDAKGVSADQRKYAGRSLRELREVLARDKDYFKSIVKGKKIKLTDPVE
jgi:SanA protein